jgi:DNA-directed RNA polymerase beta subunit
MKWSDLIKEGVIEYLDCLEEENAYIALSETELNKDNTHMEINPISIFGMATSLVPYANYNQSSKLNRGQKTQKQAMGCYTLSFPNRMDTAVNLLHYPQVPLVRTASHSLLGDERSAGQNVVIAIVDYDGYNMSDAIVLNRGSLDRGLGRSTYFRPYTTEKLRYPGGQVDEILIPSKDTQGYTVERDYRFLGEDGIIFPEVEVAGGEALIGKTSPPRFLGKLEAFSSAANIRKDTSIRTRYGESGVVNKVVITEEEGGSMLIKVDVRETRLPEVGDKYSSRHGQKGVIGRVLQETDVPFTASGIRPDIIFAPNGLPKRMTVAHLLEALAGKAGALAGRYIDGTPFINEPASELRDQLLKLGFRDDGTETLYDGRTGREFPARIFVGNMFYLRLKHQVADKVQSRARGPIALLTRQPTEGKAKEGGLRLGEMEKETFIAHGASLLMKERFDSDKAVIWICERCGDIAVHDIYKNKAFCLCGEKTKVAPVELSYAFKLFIDELKSLHIRPKLKLKERY